MWLIDLKARFRAKSEKLKVKPLFSRDTKQGRVLLSVNMISLTSTHRPGDNYSEAPALPNDTLRKAPKVEMEDFLDDLLS